MAAALTFLVPGQSVSGPRGAARAPGAPGAAPTPHGAHIKTSIRVGAPRAQGAPVRVEAVPGEDVVRLQLANGPELYLHPETARDLMLAQGGTARGGAAAGDGEIAVPVQMHWDGLEQAAPTRGFMGDVLLKAFEVLTGFAKDEGAKLVASAVTRKLDDRVAEGVYALQREGPPEPFKPQRIEPLPKLPASRQPILVFIHGTFVDTSSTFAKLWRDNRAQVERLFEERHYGKRVYALDHATLRTSPIANALTLVDALPDDAVLHLVSHSRGGLVAEVLARLAHQRGIDDADLAFFAGDDHADDRRHLKKLADAMRDKRIRVARVVRVACPARGTLLAGKRLDAYLSVLKWTLELAQVPVAPDLVEFLAEVARRRADPTELPGLAAMMPGAPLQKWLNAAPQPIAGDLRVVAGDLQGDSLGSWIKTLLADAYYWTDNDIVVQTRSMYAGAPRAGGATFLLDQGGKTTHFNYFSNVRTAKAVADALLEPKPAEFAPIGQLSWAGESATGARGPQAARAQPDPKRPAVFVLPGILGSNLKVDERRIWLGLGLVCGLEQLRYQPAGADHVSPDGPIGLVYDDLIAHLQQTHEVIPFDFDWRRPIDEEARRLADAVDAALRARAATRQPVRLLAHSMGGLVARTMQIERPKTWDAMMKHEGARLLMLGTPNGGSWAPMQVLSGDDTFGNTLVAFGSPFSDHGARTLMAAMPGFIQLQAGLLDPDLGLDSEKTWRGLAERDYAKLQERNHWHRYAGEAMEAAYRWGVPPQAVLNRAKELRERLDKQRDEALPDWASRLLLVVGRAKFTPAGFAGGDGDTEFTYLDAVNGGDGRVPLESALLPGVRTWTLDCEHGALPSDEKAFDAYVELLEKGDTKLLESLAVTGGSRGRAKAAAAAPRARSRPSRERTEARPPSNEREVFGVRRPAVSDGPRRGATLLVRVLNGNLAYVREPLLLGHYPAAELTGSEKVVNRLVGDSMRLALDAGLYPEAVGTQQIFVNTGGDPENPWALARPQAAIVVGLGPEGELDERGLSTTVRQGVIAWAQREAENPRGAPASIALTATLAGSSGTGVSAEASARAIVGGVVAANLALAEVGWPQVETLTLIELFHDRAAEAWRSVRAIADADSSACTLVPAIATGTGARRTPETGSYRGVGYEYVRIADDGRGGIEFSLSGRRARTEVYGDRVSIKVVRELVARAAQLGVHDAELGRTLFQLLVPAEAEPLFASSQHLVLDLDRQTAPIPWELLEAMPDEGTRAGRGPAEEPWAIRCRLLRKLRTRSFRSHPSDARLHDHVLVIGEPEVPEGWRKLPGALAEARAVYDTLGASQRFGRERINALIGGANAGEVITALLARRYRIVHIAGHGASVEDDQGQPQPGGVVLSDEVFLGPAEIRKMRIVPELVFLNCCNLAARHGSQVLADFSRFAANVAEQLIEIGVRCVVAAGWEVDDGPACEFARAFYGALLEGKSFNDAVAEGRRAAWTADRGGNTWGAYQCYGDPGWTLRFGGNDPNQARGASARTDDGIASSVALATTLEDLALDIRHAPAPADQKSADEAKERWRERLADLEEHYGKAWGQVGAVAEAFALAYDALGNRKLGDRKAAIAWYQKAVRDRQGTASMRAAEQLYNLQAREAWGKAKEAKPGSRQLDAARNDLVKARKRLHELAEAQPTVERWSLVGSAEKRLAMLERYAGKEAAATTALKASAVAYGQAEQLAMAAGDPEAFYPALNRMALELHTQLGTQGWSGIEREALDVAEASLRARHDASPDFWSATSGIELQVYRAISARTLARALDARTDGIRKQFEDVYLREAAPTKWASVADQADLVLGRYAEVADGGEKKAAQDLIKLLRSYASGEAKR